MSQDLLNLEDRLSNVNRGASPGTIENNTFPHKYKKVKRSGDAQRDADATAATSDDELDKCTICISEFEEQEDVR